MSPIVMTNKWTIKTCPLANAVMQGYKCCIRPLHSHSPLHSRLDYNQIDDKGTVAVAESLKHCTQLQGLGCVFYYYMYAISHWVFEYRYTYLKWQIIYVFNI